MEIIKKKRFTDSQLKALERDALQNPSKLIIEKAFEIASLCDQYFGGIRQNNVDVYVNVNAGKALQEKTKELSDLLTETRRNLKDGIELVEKVKNKNA